MTPALPGPIELPDGSVLVPAHLAAAVRRILIRDLAEHIRADGGAPTAGARQLVYALGRAGPRTASFANETPDTTSPMLEVSTTEAAALLGASAQHVRGLCRSGLLLGRRTGRTWLINVASLDAYRFGARKGAPAP